MNPKNYSKPSDCPQFDVVPERRERQPKQSLNLSPGVTRLDSAFHSRLRAHWLENGTQSLSSQSFPSLCKRPNEKNNKKTGQRNKDHTSFSLQKRCILNAVSSSRSKLLMEDKRIVMGMGIPLPTTCLGFFQHLRG